MQSGATNILAKCSDGLLNVRILLSPNINNKYQIKCLIHKFYQNTFYLMIHGLANYFQV